MLALAQRRWTIPAEAVHVGTLRREVERVAAEDGLSAEQLADVRLAVSEAVSNAVRHGFPRGAVGTIEVTVLTGAAGVRVRVADDGIGIGQRSEDPGSGFGLGLIGTLADSTTTRPTPGGGHTVEMLFCGGRAALAS